MARFTPTETDEPIEKAILVGIDRMEDEWPVDESLAELERLASTAGVDTVATISQRLTTPNPRTFIGSGKTEELAELCRSLAADVVIFDDELTPSQQSNLEKAMPKDVKVIDRTALILDIFALHATSKEGRLQVRLAQNQYLLPRLRGMWAHLASNRMGGGVGSRFGEGESQLEVDRRMVRKRITSIKRELTDLARVRDTQRKGRYQSGVFVAAIAGYTNAGKSSLLNALTDSNVLSYDKLFATLDSTTRHLDLPQGRRITLTDTVGFIQKLPHTLVEAFKSTLDEVSGADLILHVIDASSPQRLAQMQSVDDVLASIGAEGIERLLIFNKIDLLSDEEAQALKNRYPRALCISAREGVGLDELIGRLSLAAAAQDTLMTVRIPYTQGALLALAHEKGRIVSELHDEFGTLLTLGVGKAIVPRFEPYKVQE